MTAAQINNDKATPGTEQLTGGKQVLPQDATAGGPVGDKRNGSRRRRAGRVFCQRPSRTAVVRAACVCETSRLASSNATSARTTHR